MYLDTKLRQMKKHLLTLLLALLTVYGYAQTNQAPAKQPTTKTAAAKAVKVYICKGGSAYAFHSSSSCSGLNRCSHTISAVTKADAESRHDRRPCKKCY